MIFQTCFNTTEQGSIGEARAIYEYIKRGFVVSKPINDKSKYDLLIDAENSIKRVQVKTTTKRNDRTKTGYSVRISSSYSNRTRTNLKTRTTSDYDILFVLTEQGDIWSIPVEALGNAGHEITVGTKKYDKYKI